MFRKMKTQYREMAEYDIEKVVPLYVEYYNNKEDGEWTAETTYKRIHQVWSREDSYCLIFVNQFAYNLSTCQLVNLSTRQLVY